MEDGNELCIGRMMIDKYDVEAEAQVEDTISHVDRVLLGKLTLPEPGPIRSSQGSSRS